jgi:hypothetical protein
MRPMGSIHRYRSPASRHETDKQRVVQQLPQMFFEKIDGAIPGNLRLLLVVTGG